jgi:hypothetical protein
VCPFKKERVKEVVLKWSRAVSTQCDPAMTGAPRHVFMRSLMWPKAAARSSAAGPSVTTAAS